MRCRLKDLDLNTVLFWAAVALFAIGFVVLQ
jgi:hypothetical protein